MPEIKLGSSANMKNINLGVIELQEVYLGNVLVWQNNLGPAYATLIWDGTTFTLPARASGEPMEKFTRAFTSVAGNFAGARSFTLSLQTISDPDNEREPGTNDYLVGYRLQRPDGTYAAGDPTSSGNNSFGAPIKEFGASLPNASATWNSVDEEFTSGNTTLTVSNIPVALRETDPSGNVVDSTTQTFVDAGDWEIIVVDSRGGESSVGTLEIDLIYDAPSGQQVNSITQGGQSAGSAISTSISSPTSYTNTVIGGPSTAILSFNNTGGPLSTTPGLQYSWSCISGCSGTSTNSTFQASIPQSDSGGASPARVRLTTIGRAYNGNAAGVTTVSDVYFRSGPSLTAPSFSITGAGICNPGGGVSGNWSAVSTNTIGTFVRWNPTSNGSWSGTCPACGTSVGISGGVSVNETRNVGGTNVNSLSSTASASVTGANPNIGFSPTISGTCPNVASIITNTSATQAINCAGDPPNPFNPTITTVATVASGYTFSSNPATLSTISVRNDICRGTYPNCITNVNCGLYGTPIPYTPPLPAPPAPSYNSGTCTFSCPSGSSLGGGGATLSPGLSGARSCTGDGSTYTATTTNGGVQTCPSTPPPPPPPPVSTCNTIKYSAPGYFSRITYFMCGTCSIDSAAASGSPFGNCVETDNSGCSNRTYLIGGNPVTIPSSGYIVTNTQGASIPANISNEGTC